MRWLGLNDSDRKLEQLCDKERYYSLHINEEEEQMYKEEEEKRQKANEFQYSYDVPSDPAQEIGPAPPEPEEEDEVYVPAPNLDVPIDIEIVNYVLSFLNLIFFFFSLKQLKKIRVLKKRRNSCANKGPKWKF